MKRRVAFLNGNGHGGAEHITVQYAKILMTQGLDCLMMILKMHKSDPVKIKSYIPSNLRFEVKASRYRWMIFYIYKFLKRERPNAVFCSMPDISALILMLKTMGLFKGKVVIRDSNMPSRQTKRSRRFGQLLYSKADVLIAQTKEMKDEMVAVYGVDEKKIQVIYNPTDEDTIKEKIATTFPFENEYTNYVTVGRINSQKDYITAVRAFAEVLKVQPKSRYYIVGGDTDEAYVQSVRKEVSDLGIKDKVFFEGFQSNPYKYQNGCNVYVLSSIFEGLPNSMLDAMYLGKPVAATECIPYIAQVVHNGQNGYTVKVGDYKSLADAMIKASQIKNLPKFVPVNDSVEQILKVFDN